MRPGRGGPERKGTTVVEAALVYPLALLLILGVLSLGHGVFLRQQLDLLCAEGARWAAVRGPSAQQERGLAPPTAAEVLERAVYPRMVGLDRSALGCTLAMSGGRAVVTLTYRWTPAAISSGATFTSRAASPIAY